MAPRGPLAVALALACRGAVALRLAAVARDPRDDEPFCVFGGQDGFSSPVQVFVGSDNSRSLFFGTDDMGTQTSVKCLNEAPRQCASTQRAASVNDTQSCEFLECACDRDNTGLDFTYMKKMMDEVVPLCNGRLPSQDGFRMLLVGLGGGALPSYTLAHCPSGSKVESVEYDPRVVAAATGFFGLKLQAGVNEVENNDGGKAVQSRVDQAKTYDAILVDCFQTGGEVPKSCSSPEFVANLRKLLRPGGKAVQQVWNQQYDMLLKEYQQAFGGNQVSAEGVDLNFNHLVIGSAPAEAIG